MRKIPEEMIENDRDVVRVIERLPGYTSANPACSAEGLQQVEATWLAARSRKEQARAMLAQAKKEYDEACADEGNTGRLFHDLVYAAKLQVISLFGRDSFAVKAIGLIRLSDRKRPARRQGDE